MGTVLTAHSPTAANLDSPELAGRRAPVLQMAHRTVILQIALPVTAGLPTRRAIRLRATARERPRTIPRANRGAARKIPQAKTVGLPEAIQPAIPQVRMDPERRAVPQVREIRLIPRVPIRPITPDRRTSLNERHADLLKPCKRCILFNVCKANNGAMAQLVAHLHGMERVRGSNPLSSTSRVSGENRKPFFHAKTAIFQRFSDLETYVDDVPRRYP